MTFEDIRDNFELLDEWEDRYRYLIELGRDLAPMPDELKTDATKVRGCASQVWIFTRERENPGNGEPTLEFLAESDAHIVQGLIAVLLAIHNHQTPSEIIATKTDDLFSELGLKEYLTPQRSNGLASMIARLKGEAERHLSVGSAAND